MSVFCRRIQGMLYTKVTDCGYIIRGWTSKYPHSDQTAQLCGTVQCYGQMVTQCSSVMQ